MPTQELNINFENSKVFFLLMFPKYEWHYHYVSIFLFSEKRVGWRKNANSN